MSGNHFQFEYDHRACEWAVTYDGELLCTVGQEWLTDYTEDGDMDALHALKRIVGERIVEHLDREGNFTDKYLLKRAFTL